MGGCGKGPHLDGGVSLCLGLLQQCLDPKELLVAGVKLLLRLGVHLWRDGEGLTVTVTYNIKVALRW